MVALPAATDPNAAHDVLPSGQTGIASDNSAAGNPLSSQIPLLAGTAIDTSSAATDQLISRAIAANQNQSIPFDQTPSYYGADASNEYEGYEGSEGYNYEGGGYDGGYPGDYFDGDDGPVVLDLTGKGINITPKSASNTFYDLAGDGYQHHTAWAGAGDGVLVLDTQGNGKITQQNQVVFTDWDPTATTDMQALRDVFDTNHNGQLDAGDAQFANFKIMATNADGTTTLETLAQAGVSSINLTQDQTKQVFTDGSTIDGETTYTKTDGTTGQAATVSFVFDAASQALRSTTTGNADGSTTIDNQELNTDGSLAGEIKSTTSADGLTRNTSFDYDGDGVIDNAQTDQTVVNGDGSKTETLSDANAAGVLQDRTTTTSSADGKTISISRDPDGNGVTDQTETDATNSDGSKVVQVSDLNPDSSTKDTVVHVVTADGQTGVTLTDLNGDGVYDLTTVDQTATASDGGRAEIVIDLNSDNSVRDSTVTSTSADSQTQVVQRDFNGDGVYDLTTTSLIARNSDGSTTTTRFDKSANGTFEDSTQTTISADGLTTTTKSDPNGDQVADLTRVDATVINSDGSRTETISDTNIKGTLLDRTVIAKGADGVSRTTSVDADGNGSYDGVDQIVLAASGVVTETLSKYLPNGTTLENRTISTTSADGLTKTVQTDADGDGKIDDTTTVATVKNADGSATVTTTDRSNSNALLSQSTATTSADGRSTTTKTDVNGDGTYDYTTSDATVVYGDQSEVTTAATTSADGTLQSKVTTTLSGDRNLKLISSDTNGDGHPDQFEYIGRQSNGSTFDVVGTQNSAGAILSATTTTTSADGLSTTVQTDLDGDGSVDATTSDVTVLNSDGSRTETVSVTGPNNVLRKKTITTTSANGLSTTVQSDVDGNGSIDVTTSDVTTLNSDGSQTETKKQTAGGVTLSSTAVTTSANGLSKTTATDANGDGAIDTTTTDVTTLNSDGTKTETVTDTNNNGSVRDTTKTTTSADGKTTTIARNVDGASTAEDNETIAIQADGSTVDTDLAATLPSNGMQKTVTTTSANGLSQTQTIDINNNGTIDEKKSDNIVLNADGSKTETYVDNNMNDNLPPQQRTGTLTRTTTTSANGLNKTVVVSELNDTQNTQYTLTDNTVINADGSTVETKKVTPTGSTTVRDSEVITTAAHGLSKTTQIDLNGDGTYEVTDATVLNADGSQTETLTQKSTSGALLEKDVTTTSGNGLTVSVQRDTDGDGSFDQFKTTTQNADGSTTDAIWTTTASGTLTGKATEVTSADGRTKTIQFDTNGDGTIDQSENEVSTVNSDGSTTTTRSDFNSNGSLRDQTVTTTSANGYAINGTIDLDGDGTVDEKFSNNITLNSDGSKTAVVKTLYADNTLKSLATTTTSANGLVVTTNQDFDGDGKNDFTETDTTYSDGFKKIDLQHFGKGGGLLSESVARVDADGHISVVYVDYDGDGTYDFRNVVTQVGDGNGSYASDQINVQSAIETPYDGNHLIDDLGVDTFNAFSAKTAQFTTKTYTTAQDQENLGELYRLYDVMYDRDPTTAEQQEYPIYGSFSNLITKVITKQRFSTEYGDPKNASSLTYTAFIEQMYHNAYGRAAQLSELSNWLNQLHTGAATRTTIVQTLADSAEHLIDGNTHTVTNNTNSGKSAPTFDHTTDKLVAADDVDRLYLTVFHRHATSSDPTNYVADLLSGAESEADIVANLFKSAEFKADYGTLSDTQFVNQIYLNGLGRAPTAQESNTWVALLGGTGADKLTRADLVVAIADSPDHLAVANGSGASASASPATQTSTSSSSVNQMIQAMSMMTATPSSSSSLVAAPPTQTDHSLAAAHA